MPNLARASSRYRSRCSSLQSSQRWGAAGEPHSVESRPWSSLARSSTSRSSTFTSGQVYLVYQSRPWPSAIYAIATHRRRPAVGASSSVEWEARQSREVDGALTSSRSGTREEDIAARWAVTSVRVSRLPLGSNVRIMLPNGLQAGASESLRRRAVWDSWSRPVQEPDHPPARVLRVRMRVRRERESPSRAQNWPR